MSEARHRVLSHVRANSGQSIRQMGAALGLTPNGVHAHLRAARVDGLSHTDGGMAGWRLTERGEALLDAIERLPL